MGLDLLLDKLPQKYSSVHSKYIDEEGFEPSGGRRLTRRNRKSMLLRWRRFLFDEPTAALDPNVEYKIYTQFNEMIKDKAAGLITHRLSTVQLADKVAVFDGGRVVEYGTHKNYMPNVASTQKCLTNKLSFIAMKSKTITNTSFWSFITTKISGLNMKILSKEVIKKQRLCSIISIYTKTPRLSIEN